MCLTHHLLALCNPFLQGLLGSLQEVSDDSAVFLSAAGNGLQHPFTDGSCFQHEVTRTCVWLLGAR